MFLNLVRMSLEAEAVVDSKASSSERRLASATGSLGRSFTRSSRARSSDRQFDKRRSGIRVSIFFLFSAKLSSLILTLSRSTVWAL